MKIAVFLRPSGDTPFHDIRWPRVSHPDIEPHGETQVVMALSDLD